MKNHQALQAIRFSRRTAYLNLKEWRENASATGNLGEVFIKWYLEITPGTDGKTALFRYVVEPFVRFDERTVQGLLVLDDDESMPFCEILTESRELPEIGIPRTPGASHFMADRVGHAEEDLPLFLQGYFVELQSALEIVFEYEFRSGNIPWFRWSLEYSQ